DILSLDYVTAEFQDTNAVFGSYEAPFPGNDRIRWQVNGSLNEFSADQVGVARDIFDGEEWSVGAEVIWNFYQKRDLFIDFFAGIRYLDVQATNKLVQLEGEEQFFLPYLGLRLERVTERYSTF